MRQGSASGEAMNFEGAAGFRLMLHWSFSLFISAGDHLPDE